MPTIPLAVPVILSLAYGILGIVAFRHIKPDVRANRTSFTLLVTDAWWPYCDNLFNDPAKRTLLLGKLMLPIIIVTYVISFIQLR